METAYAKLLASRYMSLATFRRNGEAVNTPVWFADEGAVLYVFSAGEAGKVKRLRNSSRARVAACDYRGKLLGEWIEAQAFLIEEPRQRDRALRALRSKYGWPMRLVDGLARLSGRFGSRAYIRVVPARDAAAVTRSRKGPADAP